MLKAKHGTYIAFAQYMLGRSHREKSHLMSIEKVSHSHCYTCQDIYVTKNIRISQQPHCQVGLSLF